MAFGKWIGGALGWILSGGNVLGAIAGYCVGCFIDDAKEGSDDNGTTGQTFTIIQISTNAPSRKTATRSSFPCWCFLHILLRQTEKSCTRKWNLSAISYVTTLARTQ